MKTEKVLKEIRAERVLQQTPSSPKYLGKDFILGTFEEKIDIQMLVIRFPESDDAMVRDALVKVAALAVAAVESHDARERNQIAKAKYQECYYFGWIERYGHGFAAPEARGFIKSEHFELLPLKDYEIDGKLAPVTKPAHEQEGVCSLNRYETDIDWTVISFWDRSSDSRGKSNSTFICPEQLSFNDAVALAKKCFPKVFARFTFELRLSGFAYPKKEESIGR